MAAKKKPAKKSSQRTTISPRSFAAMVKAGKQSNALILVSEGDSWFDYPQYNLMDYLEERLRKEKVKYKMLRLESNGDEAVSMMARASRHAMAKLLNQFGNDIHVLLFSAGGNDIAGDWDLPFVIRLKANSNDSDPVTRWVNLERLDRRFTQIEHAYRDLIDLRDDYAPKLPIVTHTYDAAIPSGIKGKYLLGLIRRGPWLKPHLKHIDVELHQPIIDHILDRFVPLLENLQTEKKLFKVVNTHGTLGRNPDLWQDELHPSEDGFRLLGEKLWKKFVQIPALKSRL